MIFLYLDELHIYQNLINMGFDENISINAVQKCGKNINKCINWIMSNDNKTNKQHKNNHNVKYFFVLFFRF